MKCLHVAAMRATAVSLVFFRRPFCTPRTYAAPISPVLVRSYQCNAVFPCLQYGDLQERVFSVVLFDAAPSQLPREIQDRRE